jgi:hypothetical protein
MPLRTLLFLIVQVAGLIGTGCIVWFASIAPRLQFHHDTPGDIFVEAIEYALLAWAWSAAVALLLFAAISGDGRAATRSALRVSQTAIWLAPACLLLSQMSPAAVIPALALVVGATEMLYAQWATTNSPAALPVMDTRPRRRFEPLPERSFLRALGPPLAASFGLEAALAALAMHYPLPAGFLFAASAAILTLLMLMGGLLEVERTTSLPRSVMGIVLTVILAAGLTTVQVLYHRYLGSVSAAGEPGGDEDDSKNETTELYNSPGTVEINDSIFPGVILRPEVKPYATLVTPPPSWMNTSIASQNAQPYTIPFSGEYWMFKPPQVRPPPGAYSKLGSPLKLFYRTTDHGRMTMEAHQRLGRPIDLQCCRAIQVAISNADRYPGTVSLELILIAADTRRRPSVSLGTDKVTAWPQSGTPATEVLEYRIPPSSRIHSFSELKIVLHRDPVRTDKSARISIDRFILVPGV